VAELNVGPRSDERHMQSMSVRRHRPCRNRELMRALLESPGSEPLAGRSLSIALRETRKRRRAAGARRRRVVPLERLAVDAPDAQKQSSHSSHFGETRP
jgi:hypothetical protein